jgi:hypothetical protein
MSANADDGPTWADCGFTDDLDIRVVEPQKFGDAVPTADDQLRIIASGTEWIEGNVMEVRR